MSSVQGQDFWGIKKVNRFVLFLDWCHYRELYCVCTLTVKYSNTTLICSRMSQTHKIKQQKTFKTHNVKIQHFIIVSLKYEHTLFIKKIHMNQQSFTIQGVKSHDAPLHLWTIQLKGSTCEQCNWRDPCELVARQRAELYFFPPSVNHPK